MQLKITLHKVLLNKSPAENLIPNKLNNLINSTILSSLPEVDLDRIIN